MAVPFARPYNVKRLAEAGYVAGVWVEGQTIELPILACIQPLSPFDYDKLVPMLEGRRIDNAIKIYTMDALDVAGDDGKGGDRVLWPALPLPPKYPGKQREYRVIGLASYTEIAMGVNHNKYIAVCEAKR